MDSEYFAKNSMGRSTKVRNSNFIKVLENFMDYTLTSCEIAYRLKHLSIIEIRKASSFNNKSNMNVYSHI